MERRLAWALLVTRLKAFQTEFNIFSACCLPWPLCSEHSPVGLAIAVIDGNKRRLVILR